MDSRIAHTRLVCKLTELQDSLYSLSKQKESALRETSAAKEVLLTDQTGSIFMCLPVYILVTCLGSMLIQSALRV